MLYKGFSFVIVHAGVARIAFVCHEFGMCFVEFEELPGKRYNATFLLPEQDRLKSSVYRDTSGNPPRARLEIKRYLPDDIHQTPLCSIEVRTDREVEIDEMGQETVLEEREVTTVDSCLSGSSIVTIKKGHTE